MEIRIFNKDYTKVKNVETYICLSLILFNVISCYNFRSAKKESKIAFEDQYAKVEVTKVSDVTFESMNPSWKKVEMGRVDVDRADSLGHDYPNPFSPGLVHQWWLIEADSISISLWDTSGRMICSLYESFLEEGLYRMRFVEGNLNSGVYLVLLKKGDGKYITKTIVLR